MDRSIKELESFLEEHLSKSRYLHSINVARECVKLAEIYGEDAEKAYFAGLMHDVCKELSFNKQHKLIINSQFEIDEIEFASKPLWHAIAGAVFIRDEFEVTDSEILNAIRFHTTAHGGMSRFEEIVYLADLISIDRDYGDLEKMRELAYSDISEAMREAMAYSILSSVKKGVYLPRQTVEAYNKYLYAKENNIEVKIKEKQNGKYKEA